MDAAHRRDLPGAEPRSARRRGLAILAGALILVLAAEAAVRLLEPRLPEPPDWFSPSAARLVREMDAAEAPAVLGGLTVTGSSMAGRGLVPSVLARGVRNGMPAHSVALGGGGQASLQERWMLEEVIPRTHPDAVVWGVSSLDFNRARQPETIGRYDRARATRRDALAPADRGLARVSALARHRASLRDPYVMSKVFSGSNQRTSLRSRGPDRAITFAYRERKLSPTRLARMRRTEAAYAREVQLRDFSIGRTELDAFRRTLRGIRRSQARVAVVIMPVPRQYIAAHPGGARDYHRWERAVSRVAREEGVLLIDESSAMPASAFRDIEHLNRADAAGFSERVRRRLIRAGW
ncbi:MAG: hypothetical protein ACKO2C_06660 [Actinomycetes bacterium]